MTKRMNIYKSCPVQNYTDFYEAWHFLYWHEIFFAPTAHLSKFLQCLDVEVVKVNPAIDAIDEDESKNTKVEVWLECGAYHKDYRTHDWELDCAGDTYEEAIVNLANLVAARYGTNVVDWDSVNE